MHPPTTVMAADAFNAGNAAFVDEDYETAVEQYTAAIEAEPTNSEYLLKRAAAHIKLEDYYDAVDDTNAVIKNDANNAMAHFRKGVALFNLEEYESARDALQTATQLDSGNRQAKTWLRKCNAELAEESGNVACATTETAAAPSSTPPPTSTQTQQSQAQQEATAEPQVIEMPKPTIQHDWYQSPTHVFVTIFMKKTKPEETEVYFSENSLSVTVQQASGVDYSLEIDLCDKIVPEESKFENLKTKIEIKMKKANAAQWALLEADDTVQFKTQAVPDMDSMNKQEYPTSSRKKVNWDSYVKEFEAENKDEEGDPLNKVFQQIYGNADENTRRAMQKSFVESNGTVLSTNWEEVGAKYVEGSPPDGMEMHDWKELEQKGRKKWREQNE